MTLEECLYSIRNLVHDQGGRIQMLEALCATQAKRAVDDEAKLAEFRATAEAAQERMRLELVRMDGLARERGKEVERLTRMENIMSSGLREKSLEVERLREALSALLDLEELDLKHAYATCDMGDSMNADRGCVWCVARAALRGGGE